MTQSQNGLTWAVHHLPQPGQTLSGDNYVATFTDGGMFASVIDGLGHGEKAHKAAVAAVDALTPLPDGTLSYLMEQCHRHLIGTRGAVISMANIDINENKVRWMGVGNVTGVLLKQSGDQKASRRHLLARGGIVGYRLPGLKLFEEDLAAGDTLVFATDGIRSGFLEDLPRQMNPQTMVDHIMSEYRRGTDDALVLAVKYQPA